ncbi:hypothetical protein GQ53DRAFT_821082 [Thozetella sp. PMI_491]|nr:hypothetical protein GQ53DRAFT_821082 [Thozetella sp. PMI_491]
MAVKRQNSAHSSDAVSASSTVDADFAQLASNMSEATLHQLPSGGAQASLSEIATSIPSSTTSAPTKTPPGNKESDERSARTRFWGWSIWLVELFFLFISFAAFFAVVVVLKIFDGKPLPSLSLHLTPNTLIAFLATISKAALMLPIAEAISQCKWDWFRDKKPISDFQVFDQASRGIWGSINLLGVTRWRSIATLGATVSVIGIVTLPMIQQSLDYPTRLVSDESQLAMTSVSSYVGPTKPDPQSPVSGFPIAMALDSLDLQDSGVSLNGLDARDPSSGALQPICPTGDCTFPDMKT